MKNNQKVFFATLCGGSGSRLWPASRTKLPKQFLELINKKSLFDLTLERQTYLSKNINIASNIFITNSNFNNFVDKSIQAASPIMNKQIISEPVARNTAAAVTMAALASFKKDPEAILVIMPSDHYVNDYEKFSLAIQNGINEAEDGSIVLLGAIPTRPDTGYGYIKKSQSLNAKHNSFIIDAFTEKPDKGQALKYLASEDYLWNCGIFISNVLSLVQSIEKINSTFFNACLAIFQEIDSQEEVVTFNKNKYASLELVSFDTLIIEKAIEKGIKLKVISNDSGWSDMGTWDSIAESLEHDSNNNVLLGGGKKITLDSSDNVLMSEIPVAAIGVSDLALIQFPDVLLLADRKKSQDIPRLVEIIKATDPTLVDYHVKDFRPWGWFYTLLETDKFKVKHICINSGESISLQKHNHRSEHWTIVSGTATVTLGEDLITLNENEHVFIPQGSVHRVANFSDLSVELIELQFGSYLGEDDIVRFEDKYNRIQ